MARAKRKPTPVKPARPGGLGFSDRLRDTYGAEVEVSDSTSGIRVSFERGKDRFSRVFSRDGEWEARAEAWIASL